MSLVLKGRGAGVASVNRVTNDKTPFEFTYNEIQYMYISINNN